DTGGVSVPSVQPPLGSNARAMGGAAMKNIVEHQPSIDIIDLARQGAFDEGVTMSFPFLRLTTTRYLALWDRPKSPPDRPPLRIPIQCPAAGSVERSPGSPVCAGGASASCIAAMPCSAVAHAGT